MADSAAVSPPPPASDASTSNAATADQDHLAHGIRALALKRWSDACDHLAQAVEASTEKHGELAPENVEALVLYGKALLGSAIAQSAVLGGAAPQDTAPGATFPTHTYAAGSSAAAAGPSASTSGAAAGPSNPKFHFSGDAEEEDDEDDEGEGDEPQEGDESAAPGVDREDDLESAFQALEVARTILQREVDAAESALEREAKEPTVDTARKDALEKDRKVKKEKLADVHRLLGDVATESEQFDAAVDEYSAALSGLSRVLAPHDRALSESHMLIALALDFVPNATARAVSHAEKAKGVLLLRLAELERVPAEEREDKAKREIEDIKSLMGDVDMKIEDLRTVPEAPAPTAADAALEALLRQSQGVMAQAAASGSVNDLTSLVKRKKKAPAARVVSEEVRPAEDARGGAEENIIKLEPPKEEGVPAEGAKRKAEDTAEAGGADAKKAKVET
ncbi:hypothetical protein JCM3770_007166 [Rhodotorula araucariae]